MKKLIPFLVIVLLFSVLVTATKVMQVDLTIYKDDTVVLDGFRVYEGQVDEYPIERSDYILKLTNKNNLIIDEVKLPVSFYVHAVQPVETDSLLISAELNYNEDWKLLEVYHDDNLIFQKDIENYFCNSNNICEENENYVSCEQDCPSGSKDGWCDRKTDGKCDPDCLEGIDKDCLEEPEKKFPWPVLIIILIAVAAVIALLKIKRKK